MADELLGKTLGGYEIQRLLGQGGMAKVYLARQQSMNRQVALKVLPRQYLNDDTYLQRFEREVRIVSQLEHRHIVPVYDYGEYEGLPYIVMRYMPAGSVDDLLRGGALPPERLLHILAQVAPALDYAHSREVLHRDLKPSNVLMDDDGGAFITDFGIARLTDGQGANITTQGVVGTPSYMSPEQAQGRPLDGRSDLYSLGVMLFEMATGRRPFENDTPYSIAVMQVTTPPPSPRVYNPRVSLPLEQVILKALRKQPAERYQSAGDLLDALKQAIERPLSQDTEPNIKKPSPPMIVQAQPVIIQAAPAQPVQPLQSAVQPAPVRAPQVYQTSAQRMTPLPSVALPSYGLRSRIRQKRQSSPLFALLLGGTLGCGLLVILGILVLVGLSAAGLLNPITATATVRETTVSSRLVTFTPPPGEIVLATPRPDQSTAPVNLTAEALRSTLAARATSPAQVSPTPAPVNEATGLAGAAPVLGSGLAEVRGTLLFAGMRQSDSGTSFEIVRLDLATWQETRLTQHPADDSYPLASPDGQWIAFQSERDGDFEIFIMDVTGGRVTQVTDNNYVDRLPAWSPDGEWLIFSSDVREDGNFDLYRVQRDGRNYQPVYSSASRKSHPRYSPDGRYVVFTDGAANDSATWEIMLLETQTGAVRALTDNNRRDASPLFSPDGRSILYITQVNSSNAIAVMNIDGTEARILYNSSGSDWAASYSPDGRFIAFSSNLTGADQLYLMTAAGTDAQQITSTRGGYPSWLPGQ
jgi:serine/threonine protein kinase